jgi:hypothetical protein
MKELEQTKQSRAKWAMLDRHTTPLNFKLYYRGIVTKKYSIDTKPGM